LSDGQKKKYIKMVGSFTKPFICYQGKITEFAIDQNDQNSQNKPKQSELSAL